MQHFHAPGDLKQPLLLAKGQYRVRYAHTDADLAKAQALRFRCFLPRQAATGKTGNDHDAFDAQCQHILVENTATAQLVCCFRLQLLPKGQTVTQGYSAQVYDLSALDAFPGAKLELGRFCIDPDWSDPNILRLAWGALTQIVDSANVKLLFGCSSFPGANPRHHTDALAVLQNHLATGNLNPGPKAPETYRFSDEPRSQPAAPNRANATIPALLRTYLAMGGWVSDHAVIDRGLDTLHVFTVVEIDKIPPARARALRAVARSGD